MQRARSQIHQGDFTSKVGNLEDLERVAQICRVPQPEVRKGGSGRPQPETDPPTPPLLIRGGSDLRRPQVDRWTKIESIAILVCGVLIALLLWDLFAGNRAAEESRSLQPAGAFLINEPSI